MKKVIMLTALVVGSVSVSALAKDCNPEGNLKGFLTDSKAFMDAENTKYDKNCNVVTASKFSNEEVANKDFIALKDKQRSSKCHTDLSGNKFCMKDLAPGADVQGRAGILTIDDATNLVTGGRPIRSLKRMEALGLTKGKVKKQPWSDWFWPIADGILTYRYNSPAFINTTNRTYLTAENKWPWMVEYNTQNPATTLSVDELSPSEKYDLLMNDGNYTLTKSLLNAGKWMQDQYGKVEGWQGICHGWAAASYMLPRPKKTITVTSGNRYTKIKFLPSDLKGLGSLMWANGHQRTKFIGGRCNSKIPEKDVNGRVTDENCFDTNPGTWHMAITTELGKNKKSFIIDATYDFQVWNQPLVSYSYTYFNPKTMMTVSTIEEATVRLSNFDTDKFKKYRSQSTSTVVGIRMQVEYLAENMPSRSLTNNKYKDSTHTVYYNYDIEQNNYGTIVGGEWYTNRHPDFLWTPYTGSKANSVLDQYLPTRMTLNQVSNRRLQELVPEASIKMQPVSRVIEALFRKAAKDDAPAVQ